jgi:HK97 family phage prohead protease
VSAAARFDRVWSVADVIIRTGGRVVEAYAATFDEPYEVRDRQGEYLEVVDRHAFDAALTSKRRPVVLYHHGMTVADGKPSALGSVPIGFPVEVVADRRGLRTVTRFNRSALADAVLESIRNGEITGYSFRGRIKRSDPARGPHLRHPTRGLTTVRRLELTLDDYGPTPLPSNMSAAVLAVRYADAASLGGPAMTASQKVMAKRRITTFLDERENEDIEARRLVLQRRVAISDLMEKLDRRAAHSRFHEQCIRRGV